jgi:hypothetical protein
VGKKRVILAPEPEDGQNNWDTLFSRGYRMSINIVVRVRREKWVYFIV